MNYDRYYTCDVVNGEGLRVTLFVSGCAHACPGCYNSSTWNRLAGKPFTAEVRERLLDLCREHDGLSLSGGDPLLPANRETIADLCRRFKQRYPDKDIWMWTGYRHEEVQHLALLRDVDVLIDGRYEQDQPTTKPWRGSDNQRLIRLAEERETALAATPASPRSPAHGCTPVFPDAHESPVRPEQGHDLALNAHFDAMHFAPYAQYEQAGAHTKRS